MNLDRIKKDWEYYFKETGENDFVDIDLHFSMAMNVGSLLREIERLERCVKQLGEDWSKVVDERNGYREKAERYEKALLSIVENPKDWSKSYSNAYTESVRIALKALQINE